MALRDKLRERVQPLLEPGEQIQQVFMAQTASPYWVLLSYWVLIFKNGYRVVAVTDRNIVTMKGGAFMPSSPKSVVSRSPRTPIGPLTGKLWGTATIGGEKMWVNKRFHRDVAEADAGMGA
jgi:hypothetical protein